MVLQTPLSNQTQSFAATSENRVAVNDDTVPQAIVLVVEDDPSLLDGYADLLELGTSRYAISILKAANGHDALQIMAERTPDLIVTDVNMPEMNGYAFLEAVRLQPQWVHIPFAFLTARTATEDVARGRLSGVELYITKPFDPADFLALIEAQLDLTLRRRTQRRHSAETKRRHMLHTLQHEFRTPLNFVTAYFEILNDSLSAEEDPDAIIEYLKGIQIGVTRLTQLVRDLILVIDLTSGKARQPILRRARPITDIGNLLHRAGLSKEEQAAAQGIEFIYAIDADLPAVWGDSITLYDVFSRLIENAIKFTPRDDNRKPITLTATATATTLRLSIADHGIGVPTTAIPKLFDLFYQHDRPLLEQQGSGAGLTIARDLIALHNGHIDVESQPAQGSTFTVCLPLYDPQTMQIGDNVAAQTPALVNLLILEDEQVLLDGLRDLLGIVEEQSRYRYRVFSAENGIQGLQVLADHAIDLILCDIMMPEMDGYTFLENVQKNPTWVTIPFIFLTAHNDQHQIKLGRKLGVDEYVTKPYETAELLGVIEARLDRHFAIENVEATDFRQLRQSILDLLGPQFIDPLNIVGNHSQSMLQSVESAETVTDLKASLVAIDDGNTQLVEMVTDFTRLVELKTDATQNSAHQHTLPVTSVNTLVYAVCERYNHSAAPTQPVIQVTVDANTTVRTNNAQLLELALRRLITILSRQSSHSSTPCLHIRIYAIEDRAAIDLRTQQHPFSERDIAQIQALFTQNDLAILRNTRFGSAFVLINELIALHQGNATITVTAEDSVIIHIELPTGESETTQTPTG